LDAFAHRYIFLILTVQISSARSVSYKRFLFSCTDNFLVGESKLNADINYFIQCSANIGGALNEFHTLLIPLSLEENAIWQGVSHRTRTEIKSFISNQHYEHSILLNLPDDELNRFINLFNAFASSKKIRKAETERLKAYNTAGIFAVSFIRQMDDFICINFYRVTRERASNIHSFRVTTSTHKHSHSHVGRAHRALHWLDIQAFKSAGCEVYDFCGWYPGQEDKQLLGINKFKEQFTSYKVIEYSGVVYNHKLLKFILKLLR
jgi:hypothetical protein